MGKKYKVSLTSSEQEVLTKVISKRSSNSPQVKRSYILLAADENGSKQWKDGQIHQVYGVSIKMIERLRKRFVEDGFNMALNGKKRSVYKEKILDGEVEAKLIALRCSQAPEGYNKWTLRLLADQMVSLEYVSGISHESVRQILKKRNKALDSEELGNPNG